MKETPILFSSEMVRAILDGRKTQTRRVIDFKLNELHSSGNPVQFLGDWPLSNVGEFRDGYLNYQVQTQADDYSSGKVKCPYGQPGDILWVRETWQNFKEEADDGSSDIYNNFVYYADDQDQSIKWKPSIHMPKEAARIFLRVTNVRVERLQEILCGDMKREGCIPPTVTGGQYQQWQRDYWIPLWDAINAKRGYGWNTNPWVWVIEFHQIGGL